MTAINKDLTGGFAWAGTILAAALAASFARKQGYLDDDTVTRMVFGLIGLMIVWYGNRIPKAFVPKEQARRARRAAGWSLTLSGLAYAGVFAFASIQTAVWAGVAAIVAGMLATFGYCLRLRRKVLV